MCKPGLSSESLSSNTEVRSACDHSRAQEESWSRGAGQCPGEGEELCGSAVEGSVLLSGAVEMVETGRGPGSGE